MSDRDMGMAPGDSGSSELREHHQRGILKRALAIREMEATQLEDLHNLREAKLSDRLDDEERGTMTLAMLVRLADELGFDVRYELIPRAPAEPILSRTIEDPKRFGPRSFPKKPRPGNVRAVDDAARALPDFEIRGLRFCPRTLTVEFEQQTTRVRARELFVLKALLHAGEQQLPIEALRETGWIDEPGAIASVRFVIHKLKASLALINYPWTIVGNSKGQYRLHPRNDPGQPGRARKMSSSRRKAQA